MRKGTLTFFAVLLVYSSVLAQLSPYNGIVEGSLIVSQTGAASYIIPIDIPPGINGIQPSLSLVYNSQSGNGTVGIGFSLSGFSSITRAGATVAQDGFRGGVNYDDNDRFSLDGIRLMRADPAGSNYFTVGASYYTELQDWSKAIAESAAGTGPAFFTVYRKDGSVAQYGNGQGSGIPAQSAGGTNPGLQGSIRAWMINSLTSPNGNTIRYFYTSTPKDLQGNFLPASSDSSAFPDAIYYTSNGSVNAGRKIQFLYESRPDTLLRYEGGAHASVPVRLKAIQTFVISQSDTLGVSTYLLTYDNSAPLAVSRLASIVKTGSAGGSTQPLAFQWTNGADGLAGNAISWTGPSSNAGYEGDFNGDGKTDILPVSNNVISAIYYATGTGFTKQPLPSTILVNATTYVADYNADGLPDLLVLRGGTGLLYFSTAQGLGTTADTIYSLRYNTTGAGIWIADFNGDGMADIFSLIGTAGSLYLANGNGFNSALTFPGLSVQANQIFVADFNGDGQADIFSGGFSGGNLYLSDISRSSSFQPLITTIGLTLGSVAQNNMVADYNGDGLADILTHTGQQYNLYYSTGHGFDSAVAINNINLNVTQNWVSDFNGDGAMDFYTLSGTSGVIYYFYGNKFQAQPGSSPPFLSAGTWTGDFNGDGIGDLFAANTSTIYYGTTTSSSVLSTVNQVPNLVTTIDNGIYGIISLIHKPITDTAVYKTGAVSSGFVEGLRTQNKYNPLALAPTQLDPYPFVRTQTALYAVQNYTLSDGLGNSYPYWYQYGGSLYDIQSYGWLGFQEIIKTDSCAQNISISNYLQPFPFTGKQLSLSKTDLSGNLLYEERNSYEAITDTLLYQQSKTYQVLPVSTRSDFYDSGVFSYTTGANYRFDQYGNSIFQAQLGDTSETGAVVYTINQYNNDTTGWHLGYIRMSTQCSDSLGNNVLTQRSFTYNPNTYQVATQASWLNTEGSWLASSYGYDQFGNKEYVVNESGDTTAFVFDAYHSFPDSTVSPPNQWDQKLVNTTGYDPGSGAMTFASDPNGNMVKFVLDQFGRDSIMLGPDTSGNMVVLSQMLYFLNAAGYTEQHIIRNDWGGNSWDTSEVVYDGLKRNYKNTFRDQVHQTITQLTNFNSNNQVSFQSLPYRNGETVYGTSYLYDPYQRVASITVPGPEGGSIVSQFAYQGKQVSLYRAINTPDSVSSLQIFDYVNGVKKIVQRRDESLLTTCFGYDLQGHQTSVKDPAGLVTSYGYNSLGDVVFSSDPSSGKKTILYDYINRRQSEINNGGDTVTYWGDALKRRTAIVTPSGKTSFLYDLPAVKNGLSNLCRVVMEDTTVYYTYQYDAAHHQTIASLHIGGQNYSERFLFNADGSSNSIFYPDGSTAGYAYYDNGLLKQISLTDAKGSNTASPYFSCIQYDASSNLQQAVYGNGVKRMAAFNPTGSLSHYSISNAVGQSIADKWYSWNNINNITGITDSLDSNYNEQFQYQKNDRLLNAGGAYGNLAYGYDTAGNIVTKDSLTIQYNNYQAIGGTKNGSLLFTNTYDSSGNMASRTWWNGRDSLAVRYNFNVLNQLTSITSVGDTLFIFYYTINGQRLIKKDYKAGVTTYYVSPQYQVSVTPDSVYTTKNICGPGSIIASVKYGYALADSGLSKQGGFSMYYHQDIVNSTILTTDTTGNTSSRIVYKPFGQPLFIQGGDTATYLFGSKELDRSGLYYFNSRYYDPLTARFITPDNVPGGEVTQTDAFNRYAYTLNNPVKYDDPSGHMLGLNVVTFLLQLAADVVTEGMATPEELAMDVTLADAEREAEKEVGKDFLKALRQTRGNNAFGNFQTDELKNMYLARRDAVAGINRNGLQYARSQVLNSYRESAVDRYGLEVFKNRGPMLQLNGFQKALKNELNFLGDITSFREQPIIGRYVLSGDDNWLRNGVRLGDGLKYTISFQDYSYSIGDTQLSHAAVEGDGRPVYTSGYIKIDNDVLSISNSSGHYVPSLNSTRVSVPKWMIMRDQGLLNFNSIRFNAHQF